MAIVKMKWVSACTDHAHLDQMLMTGMKSGMLHAEKAVNIVNEENQGKLLNSENPYAGYVQTLKNIGHNIGFELTKAGAPTQTYTAQEIEDFIQELNTTFEITSDASQVTLTPEDEEALAALRECDFDKMNACQYLNFGLGRLPIDSFQKLAMYRDDNFVLHKLNMNKQYVWLVYVTSDAYEAHTKKIFESLFFEPIEIPKIDVIKLLDHVKEKLLDVYAYCTQEDKLYQLYPYIAILEDKEILSGFVKADQVEEYKKQFEGQPVDFRIKEPEQVKNCKPPTLLKNNWFARPFELFVEMYGLPSYGEMDPTFFMAITYCILFGIMFGDFGQGIALMLLGFVLEKKGKLFGIIGRVGITSAVFGFLFGSVFGYEDALNPLHQSLFHVREKLFDVMANSNTMVLLMGAIAIGAVLILMCMLLNIVNQARHKNWAEVCFSQNGIAGIIFYGFLIVAIAKMLLTGDNSLLSPGPLILFCGIPAICFLMKGALANVFAHKPLTPKEGWGGYFTENFFEVFEIVLSFVTNSMSYLRVGGFVLSHAGMMLVVMTLAKMTGGASIAVVIFGNAFVMVLEGMIVGIQTLRLEYYEMFSRYYTGGGTKFKALTATTESI